MTINVSARDVMIFCSPLVEAGKLTLESAGEAAVMASVLGDTETPPEMAVYAFGGDSPICRRYVDGGKCPPDLVREHVARGMLAWAWMEPDHWNPCRYWALLHMEEAGQLCAAWYPPFGRGYAWCGDPNGRCAGHYICLDEPFVSAARHPAGKAHLN